MIRGIERTLGIVFSEEFEIQPNAFQLLKTIEELKWQHYRLKGEWFRSLVILVTGGHFEQS